MLHATRYTLHATTRKEEPPATGIGESQHGGGRFLLASSQAVVFHVKHYSFTCVFRIVFLSVSRETLSEGGGATSRERVHRVRGCRLAGQCHPPRQRPGVGAAPAGVASARPSFAGGVHRVRGCQPSRSGKRASAATKNGCCLVPFPTFCRSACLRAMGLIVGARRLRLARGSTRRAKARFSRSEKAPFLYYYATKNTHEK